MGFTKKEVKKIIAKIRDEASSSAHEQAVTIGLAELYIPVVKLFNMLAIIEKEIDNK